MREIPGIGTLYSEMILRIFKSLFPGTQVVLFGSRAKGVFREGSDIDLVVKGRCFTSKEKEQIMSAYEELFLPWKLDLVLYDSIQEPALKHHIDRVGVLLEDV